MSLTYVMNVNNTLLIYLQNNIKKKKKQKKQYVHIVKLKKIHIKLQNCIKVSQYVLNVKSNKNHSKPNIKYQLYLTSNYP